MKVGVVLNPIAGGGKLKRHWAEAAASLTSNFGDFDLRETQTSGDADIPVGRLSPGMYFLQLGNEKGYALPKKLLKL